MLKKTRFLEHASLYPCVCIICFLSCENLQKMTCKGNNTYQLMDSKALVSCVLLLHLLIVLVSDFDNKSFFVIYMLWT